LAVSESYVQIFDLCHKHNMKAEKVELEPDCWRIYADKYGRTAYLKPDLFSVIYNEKENVEDNWFLEIDLETEAPSVVLEKCKRYIEYHNSGAEQKQSGGLFPLVVWIVKRKPRMETLRRYIADCPDFNQQAKSIFVVITANEFETLLCGGLDALRKGDASND